MYQAWGHHCSLSHIRNHTRTQRAHTRCCSSLRSHKHTYFQKQKPKRNAKEEIVCALFFFSRILFHISFFRNLFPFLLCLSMKCTSTSHQAASSFKIRVLCVRCCCLLCFYQFSVSNSCTCMHFEFTIIYTAQLSKAHSINDKTEYVCVYIQRDEIEKERIEKKKILVH